MSYRFVIISFLGLNSVNPVRGRHRKKRAETPFAQGVERAIKCKCALNLRTHRGVGISPGVREVGRLGGGRIGRSAACAWD